MAKSAHFDLGNFPPKAQHMAQRDLGCAATLSHIMTNVFKKKKEEKLAKNECAKYK